MESSMVTGRMPAERKEAGNAVLARAGLNASQAINLLYQRLIDEQDSSFLTKAGDSPSPADWAQAAAFVDALVEPRETRFDTMTRAEIKLDRLASKGLI